MKKENRRSNIIIGKVVKQRKTRYNSASQVILNNKDEYWENKKIMKLIQAYEEQDLVAIQKLYREAFPIEERKPFSMLLQKRGEQFVEILAIKTEEDRFCGLAITVLHKDMVLLDYFAIANECRDGGLGTKALGLLKARYADRRFFLEIESTDADVPDRVNRMRRKAFYEKNGLTPTSLLVNLFGVEMEILVNSCTVRYEEYHEMYEMFGTDIGDKVTLIHE